ncbi:MAG: dUTP diphosphatase [Phycisphaerales bacterium]
MTQPTLQLRVLRQAAIVPSYQSEGAAGLDIAACLDDAPQGITLPPGGIAVIPTGLAMAIPPGYEGQVRPRSGLASKHGVTLPNAPGTIDADYRGEFKVPLINLGREPVVITHGMRIAQLVIAPVSHAQIRVVAELGETARGAGGFGSTGTH